MRTVLVARPQTCALPTSTCADVESYTRKHNEGIIPSNHVTTIIHSIGSDWCRAATRGFMHKFEHLGEVFGLGTWVL